MYAYIKGIVSKITPKNIVIENNGIGYLVIVSNPYNFKINEEYQIFTYQYVREDIIDLYGFKTNEEKELFLKLLSVNGIGPKSALSILASGTVNDIVKAIEDRNDAYLRKFPGIGQKASLQIILDLKGKITFEDMRPLNNNSRVRDVEDALLALGYNKKEITKVLMKIDNSLDESDMIRQALQQMIK